MAWWIWILIGGGIFIGLVFMIIMLVKAYIFFGNLFMPQILQYFPLLEAEKLMKDKTNNKDTKKEE